MNSFLIIYYIGFIVWLIPPFRQYRGNYFPFFLILALTDPIALTLNKVFNINPTVVFFIASFLLLVSVSYTKSTFINILFISIGLLILLIGLLFMDLFWILIGVIILNLFIIIILTKNTLLLAANEYNLNIFMTVLIIYEISIVIKLIFFLPQMNYRIDYFYLTTAFQILFGIYFSIFTENDRFSRIRVANP